MTYKRKTTDEYQVLQNYGIYGWEIVGYWDNYRDAQRCAKDYRKTQPQYKIKIKKMRVKNEK